MVAALKGHGRSWTVGPERVAFAENGRQALAGCIRSPLRTFIVLDLRMPVMNGREFRAIQKNDPKDAFSFVGSAAVKVLSKPFTLERLRRFVCDGALSDGHA